MSERELSFEVGPSPDVAIRMASGHVQVVEGRAGTIGVSITAANPDKLLVQQVRDHVQVGAEGRLRGSYHLRLEVPAGTGISVAVASSDIDVQVPVGDFTARSASGDLVLAKATGRIEVKVAAGDVTIGEAGGDTRVVSASGDVKIGRADSDCSVATASGDLRLGTVGGTLTVKTASGDVHVECCEGETLSAASVSGRLDLRVKPGRRVDLDLNTMSGRVDLPAPSDTPSPATGPEMRLVAKTVSGNIKIGRADS